MEERLLDGRHIDEHGCWIWTGTIGDHGYGIITLARGKGQALTHRIAYETWVGLLGDETVHHKCATRACFNPNHLQRASQRENSLESYERRMLKRRIMVLECRVRELEDQLGVPRSVGFSSTAEQLSIQL